MARFFVIAVAAVSALAVIGLNHSRADGAARPVVAQLSGNQVTSAQRGRRGRRGRRGPRGRRGAQGAQGAPGVQRFSEVLSGQVSVPSGQVGSARADCPAGTAPSGTGFNGGIGNVGFVKRFGQFVGIGVYNDTSITIQIEAQAICASGPGVSAASSRVGRPEEAKFRTAVAKLAHRAR